MPLEANHQKVISLPDGPDPAEAQPSDWNAPSPVTGELEDTSVVLDGAISPYADGATLHSVLSGIIASISGAIASAFTQVRKNSTGTNFARNRLNFIEGTGVTITMADDSSNNEVDITIAATGGSGGGGNATSPKARFEDDCFYIATTTRYGGNTTQWQSGSGAGISSGGGTATGNHPGLMQVSCSTVSTGAAALAGGEYYLGGALVTFETVFALGIVSSGTNTYTVRAGLMDDVLSEPNAGVYFRYTHSVNSGKWQGVVRASGTETAVDLGVTPAFVSGGFAAAFVRLGFVIAADRSSIQFYINGTAAGSPVTTNVPATSTLLMLVPVSIVATAGNSFNRYALLDYYSVEFAFTTPR